MLSAVLIISSIGLICGVVLVIAAKVLAVPVDEKAVKIRECLPGANCGACGFAGCDDYAKNLAANPELKPNLCVPGGAAASKTIAEILGVVAEETVPTKAYVRCSGTPDKAPLSMDYDGPKSCSASKMYFGGRKNCAYGCLGYGDCVAACKFDAMHIVDGIASVDRDACVGCAACAKACPNGLIAMLPETSLIAVGCSSHDKGAAVMKACDVGCIGCMKCVKTCEHGAISVTNFLASIDPEKCVNCGKCAEACPRHIIHKVTDGACAGCPGCASKAG